MFSSISYKSFDSDPSYIIYLNVVPGLLKSNAGRIINLGAIWQLSSSIYFNITPYVLAILKFYYGAKIRLPYLLIGVNV